MTNNIGLAPVVTDADRQWALAQCPVWAVRAGQVNADETDPDEGEIVDEPYRRKAKAADRPLVWDDFVSEQIENFERFFGDQRKSTREWSDLWRKGWWPKANPRVAHASKVPPMPGVYPTYRKGSAEFDAACKIANPTERAVMLKVGLVMYRPDDARLPKIRDLVEQARAARLTDRSLAMSGDGQ